MIKKNHQLKLLAVSMFMLSFSMISPATAQMTKQYVDDATITVKVKQAIYDDAVLKVLQVSVDTNQGSVRLSGTVDSKIQKTEAILVAGKVAGVVAVTDNMSVKGIQGE